MRRAHVLLYMAAALAGALLSAAPATAALPAWQQAFAADSGDACQYGFTRGVLSSITIPTRTVQADGNLLDRPTSPGIPEICPSDGRFSVAIFTASSGGLVVDAERVAVDNGIRKYHLELINAKSSEPIDEVSVQVCRQSLAGTVFDYCGPIRTFPVPVR